MAVRERTPDGTSVTKQHDLTDDDPILSARIRVPEHVIYRSFEAETVLLNLQTGQYHGVNATGGRMLELIDQIGSVRQAAIHLAAEYGQDGRQVTDDVLRFCRALVDRGLVEVEAEDGSRD